MRSTIKLKLGVTFTALTLMLFAVVGVGNSKMSVLNDAVSNVIAGPAKRLETAQALDGEIGRLLTDQLAVIVMDDEDVMKMYNDDITRRQANFDQLLKKGEDLATVESKPIWQKAATDWQALKPVYAKVQQLGSDNKNAESLKVFNEEQKALADTLSDTLSKIVIDQKSEMKTVDDSTDILYDNARTVLFTTAAIALMLAIGGGLWISLLVSRGLKRVSNAVDAVAIGDLDNEVQVTSNDEIKDLVSTVNRMTVNLRASAALADKIAAGDLTVNHTPLSEQDRLGHSLVSMVERLRTVVGDATAAAESVSSGSQQLSASSEQVSQGATEQAASAEEASASMEQMAANIKQNADNAAQTEKIARQSSIDAEASGVAVDKAVDAMRTIAEKIGIVQEIARQTDLLALNAAVEAARAGEHGRGFAVVASEVRKLAERSQTAAAEISSVSSQTVKAASEAGEMLTKLVPDIRRTAELVSEISAACREQDIGASQINEAIQQLDKVTQQNAGASEQITTTSEQLAGQAEELQASIAFFRIDDDVPVARATPPARVAPARKAATKAPVKAKAKSAPKAKAKHGSIGDQQARARGFALNLSNGGPDAADKEFGEAA